MAISIRAAHNYVKSERYNKKNVLVYMVLVTLASIFSGLCTKNTTPTIVAAAVLINFIVLIICIGVAPLAIHNRYMESENIFPSVIGDIKNILLVAFKNIAGVLIVSIILGCVLGLITVLTLKLSPIAGIIILIPLFFIYLLLITALYAQFTFKLDLKDWLQFKNALNLIKSNYKSFCIYYLKNIILYIIALIPAIILILAASAALTILSHGNSGALNITSSIIGGIIGSVIGTYLALYAIDITGQFLQEIMPKAE